MPTHAEKRTLPYTPEQLFDMVADVDKYPEFLPWCIASRIMQRDGTILIRLPQPMKDTLRQIAEDDGRSMSGLVVKILSDWLRANGYIDTTGKPVSKPRRRR